MADLKSQLFGVKRQMYREKTTTITLPPTLTFKHGDIYNFDDVLRLFDWSLENRPVRFDFKSCKSANWQALTLIIPYAWRLRSRGCKVSFDLDDEDVGASSMWKKLGAPGLFHVSTDENTNFRSAQTKPLIAIRNSADFKSAITEAETYTKDFNIEYKNTLHYVLSELLYNTLEHGVSYFSYKGKRLRTPSLIQFTWYQTRNELQFLIVDSGVGIKAHLSQAYPGLESDEEAIRLALRPGVSGTFGKIDPYKEKNNAGVGLYISSNIIRRLKADMHIVSGKSVLHISPRDITSRNLSQPWNGTFVLVSIQLENIANFSLHSIMSELRDAAEVEMNRNSEQERKEELYVHFVNHFGPYAEDKDAAKRFRDGKLLPAIEDGKRVKIDFYGVDGSPHSFLSALLATPVKRLGISAYKRIKIVNASPEIRETIDFIFDENTDG